MTSEYLSKLAGRLPAHQQILEEINDLHQKKLWYNLTDKIEAFVSSKDFYSPQGAQILLEFYDNFLKEFELSINLLRLAQIISIISGHLNDSEKAIEFINSVIEKVQSRKDNEAVVVLKVQVALWKLRAKDALATKKTLEEAKELIDKTGFVDNIVNAAYYKAQADYNKVVDDPNEFYRSALLFLAYTPIENIQLRDRQAMAYDLGMAALLGDQIYNFGELLAHPVIESLNGTEADWLVKLLFAFNKGRIEEYADVNQAFKRQIDNIAVLQHRKQFLEEKMKLMAVLELVFSKPADDRAIPFSDVSQATGSSEEAVEPLLLKALAYGLIRGKIDEIAQKIHITWVQPRVLDKDQISQLKFKVGSWLAKVDNTLDYLQKQGTDEITTTSS